MKKLLTIICVIGLVSITSCSSKTCPTYAKHNGSANMDLNKCHKMQAYSAKK